jgi:hypothetical protein
MWGGAELLWYRLCFLSDLLAATSCDADHVVTSVACTAAMLYVSIDASKAAVTSLLLVYGFLLLHKDSIVS